VCVGGRNPFKDRRSEELTLFTSVDEVPVADSLGNKGLEALKEDKSSKEERYQKLKGKNDCDRRITGKNIENHQIRISARSLSLRVRRREVIEVEI
jgi:hypothetical protein